MSSIYNGSGIELSHTVQTDPHAEQFSLHVHDCYEILCFVSGKVGYLVEGHEYSMPHGCIMLMRPAETHKLVVKGRGDYERYVLHFRAENLRELGMNDELLSAFNDRMLGEKNQYIASELSGLEPIGVFKRMSEECAVLEPRCVVLANLCSLLCAVNTAFLKKDIAQSESVGNSVGREILEYINGNLTEELSLESICEHVHISASQANRIFRKMTGTSVYDYIVSKRLVMARELILAGEGAISASQRCGFGDYSSFYRLYKKRMGEAPTAKNK